MKKSLTLIELIFTIVIIAFVFTVIPKIIYISNKTLEFSKKEDAMFNMMAKMMDVSLKEFDENNTMYDDILVTKDLSILDCNISSGYRRGGFLGSRNCKNNVGISYLGQDINEPPYDDIDDYNDFEKNTTKNGHTVYTLHIKISYVKQWNSNNYGSKELNWTFSKVKQNKSNVKNIYIWISQGDENISSIKYNSANIGHIKVNSVYW